MKKAIAFTVFALTSIATFAQGLGVQVYHQPIYLGVLQGDTDANGNSVTNVNSLVATNATIGGANYGSTFSGVSAGTIIGQLQAGSLSVAGIIQNQANNAGIYPDGLLFGGALQLAGQSFVDSNGNLIVLGGALVQGTLTNAGSQKFMGSNGPIGNGAGLTNIQASSLPGVVLTNGNASAVTFGSNVTASNFIASSSVQVISGAFIGNGQNLTNVDPMFAFTNEVSGHTIPTNVLPASVNTNGTIYSSQWWVDATTGLDANSGRLPTFPMLTITNALAAANAYVATNGGIVVINIGAGTNWIPDGTIITNGVYLKGKGRSTSFILSPNSGTPCSLLFQGANLGASDLGFVCTNSNPISGALHWQNVTNLLFERLTTATNCYQGLDNHGSVFMNLASTAICRDCLFQGCAGGAQINAHTGAQNSTFEFFNCQFFGNTAWGTNSAGNPNTFGFQNNSVSNALLHYCTFGASNSFGGTSYSFASGAASASVNASNFLDNCTYIPAQSATNTNAATIYLNTISGVTEYVTFSGVIYTNIITNINGTIIIPSASFSNISGIPTSSLVTNNQTNARVGLNSLNTIYVSQSSGSDSVGVGTNINLPFKTIQAATNLMAQLYSPGVTNIIHLLDGGIYTFTNAIYLTNNEQIIGPGGSSASLQYANFTNTGLASGIIVAGDNVRLQGFTLGTATANGAGASTTTVIPMLFLRGTNFRGFDFNIIGDSDCVDNAAAILTNGLCDGEWKHCSFTSGFDIFVIDGSGGSVGDIFKFFNCQFNGLADQGQNNPPVRAFQNLNNFTFDIEGCQFNLNSTNTAGGYGVAMVNNTTTNCTNIVINCTFNNIGNATNLYAQATTVNIFDNNTFTRGINATNIMLKGTSANVTFLSSVDPNDITYVTPKPVPTFCSGTFLTVYLRTNSSTTPPAAFANGGLLWNSNFIPYWISPSETNVIFRGVNGGALTNITASSISGTVTNTSLVYRSQNITIGNLATSVAVTFSTPFPAWVGTNYSITFGADGTLGAAVSPGAQSKTTNGFTMTVSAGIAGGAQFEYQAWPYQ